MKWFGEWFNYEKPWKIETRPRHAIRAEKLGLKIPGDTPMTDAIQMLLDEIERLQKGYHVPRK